MYYLVFIRPNIMYVLSRVGHPFFSKECNVLAIFTKNGTIFAFFSVLYKRTKRSLRYFTLFYVLLRSFTFFIKERKRTLHSFWLHKSYKNCKSCKKERKRMQLSFNKVKKELNPNQRGMWRKAYNFCSKQFYTMMP